MKYSKLYWKGFRAWLACFTLCYGSVIDAIFAIGMFAWGDSLLSAQAFIMYAAGMVLATLPAAGSAGWLLSDLTKFSEPTRTLLLCESARQGWRMTILLNPGGWCVWLGMFLYQKLVEPLVGVVWLVVHNTRTIDDRRDKKPMSQTEITVYTVMTVIALTGAAVVWQYRSGR
ncbi:MAG: hypothetical protein WCT45_01535 [Candidatus Paceibacterota bacterium]|jgi:hypothetical protein